VEPVSPLGPLSNPLAIVSHRGPSLSTSAPLPRSYQRIGARIYPGALEVPLTIDGMVLNSKGGSYWLPCASIAIHPAGLPIAQIPPQLSTTAF
jgi:hypothetical protein